MSEPTSASGPDLSAGVPLSQVPDGGLLLGQVKGEPVVLAREGQHLYALAAGCTHYGAPLAEGVLIGGELRCPWHHARFDVRTGEALGPPALRPLDTWEVKLTSDRVSVNEKRAPKAAVTSPAASPASVVIAGGGAAADAAADMLRRRGYQGAITLVARDAEPQTVDRPNLSKDYLAGTAPEEWIPLRTPDWYADQRITLLPKVEVTKLDTAARAVTLSDGRRLEYGALLLATGASPIRLDLPGAALPHVLTLRSLPDSRAIIARAKEAKRAVVLGASFIGLEAAASLRQRGLDVHVVAPEALPLERVLGPQLGARVKALHEAKGVVFHLSRKPAAITEREVKLDDSSTLPADLVVMGVGVRPNVALAEAAGLKVDRGVVVDATLRTSAAGVWAAGDIARFPFGETTARIEHWAVAQRHGQVAARNMLGAGEAYRAVPFFWSRHYDTTVNYVGWAEAWDRAQVNSDVVAYWKGDRIVAVATVNRDRDSLLAEDALARGDAAALAKLVA